MTIDPDNPVVKLCADGMSAEAWKELLDTWTDGSLLPAKLVWNYKKSVATITYLKTLPLLDHVPRVTLLVAIKDHSVQGLLSEVSRLPGASVFISDASGAIITQVTADPGFVTRVARRSWPLDRMESVSDARGRTYFAFRTCPRVSLDFRAMRSLEPSWLHTNPTRVGRCVLGSTGRTLEIWMGVSLRIRPPCGCCREGRRCR